MYCTAISMESSRWDLLNDMAEHRSVLKNNENTNFSLVFQDKSLCSATSEESSRQDLLNDMPELSLYSKMAIIHSTPSFLEQPYQLKALSKNFWTIWLSDLSWKTTIVRDHPRFGFTPKAGIAFPKTGVLTNFWETGILLYCFREFLPVSKV